MRGMLRWPGGKGHKLKVLIPAFPEHETYVEPFAGGAALFWAKKPAAKSVLGDMNDWLIHFYDEVRRGGLRKCGKMLHTRDNFDKMKLCSSTCCRLFINKTSWHGDMQALGTANPNGKPVAMNVLRNLEQYERRLASTHLRLGDFEDTMRMFDSPTTFHYLDPPWTAMERSRAYSKKHYHKDGGGDDVPVEKVARVASEMEGEVMISYDDTDRARKAFLGANLYVYLLPTTRASGRDGTVVATELVVTNYALPDRLKGR